MAERRMFAKTIVMSDAFLDMPPSTRCLYFGLGMMADDDGFVNSPKSIMRQVGASPDDINILVSKRFIIPFDSGVIVLKHWKIHNYIPKDRYTETKYIDEKASLMLDENNAYTLGEGVPINFEKVPKPLTEAQQKRLDAKKESSLPYSFDYKIRQAFHGENCPICGRIMDSSNNLCKPTIQHNLPISLGGKHEIDNISVICSSCNCSIQNKQETPPYNTDKVIEIWECIGNVPGMYTQDRIGEERIGKDNSFIHSAENVENFSVENSVENLDEPMFPREYLGGIGKGVVFLNNEQIGDLIDKLGIEEFDYYVGIVADCELKGKSFRKKTHYQAILDMAFKDRKINKGGK